MENHEIIVCTNCGETKLVWETVCPLCKETSSK